jgi:quercetin dioxygenase-like cupin family protein
MRFILNQQFFITICIAGLLLASSVQAVETPSKTSPIKSEILLKTESSWDGVPYQSYPNGAPELTTVKISIPPHTVLPWHTHPMPNVAYVLSGELTVEKKANGQTKLLKTGDVLSEMVNQEHRGFTGDDGVVLLVFYAGVKDMPLSQLAK